MLNKIRYKVIQSQVISASLCERDWSAHGHIHTKICNRLDPATTEKLVYVYSNSKLVASTRDADKLKMFAWDNRCLAAVNPANLVWVNRHQKKSLTPLSAGKRPLCTSHIAQNLVKVAMCCTSHWSAKIAIFFNLLWPGRKKKVISKKGHLWAGKKGHFVELACFSAQRIICISRFQNSSLANAYRTKNLPTAKNSRE